MCCGSVTAPPLSGDGSTIVREPYGDARAPGCLHRWVDGATIVLVAAHRGGLGVARGEGKGGDVAQYEAYCVKCKTKRTFEGTVVTLKNGRSAAQGTCPVCGTKVMRILGKADVAAS